MLRIISQQLDLDNQLIEYWSNKYPPINGHQIGNLTVTNNIPNTDSISASLYDYKVLNGVRQIPMSDFSSSKPHDNFYARNDIQRSQKLTEQIKSSRLIDPLIVVIDKEGPYILEGAHRFVALGELGLSHMPALVVIDLDLDLY